jgi:hypothetical protein
MNIHKLVLLLLTLTFSFPAVCEEVWVALVIDENRNHGNGSEYYGSIDSTTFESLTTELRENAIFKLNNVFWINDEGKKERMSTTSRHGHRYGYTDTVYFREDGIGRIVLLDKEYLDTLKEK